LNQGLSSFARNNEGVQVHQQQSTTAMLQRLSFKRKIGALVSVSIFGLCVFAASSFMQLRTSIVDGRKTQLVAAVTSARSIVASYQAMAASGVMSVADAQKAAKDALRSQRYGATHADYIYIFSVKGDGVMHPFKKDCDGQPMLGKVKDSSGTFLWLSNASDILKHSEWRIVGTQPSCHELPACEHLSYASCHSLRNLARSVPTRHSSNP